MTTILFAQLFSMPAFEGLRMPRLYADRYPDRSIGALVDLIRKVEADAQSYDFSAALLLHDITPKSAPKHDVGFYRICLASVLLSELPEWAKLVTLGRGRFIKRLRAPEYRDVRSLFRQARLLDEPPSLDDIGWWDELQSHVRSQQDTERMARARHAELLSLKLETERCGTLGIATKPIWMAIEDNTAGYDILSYSMGEFGPLNRLIEVKSAIASPLRFFLTRNEWEQALSFASSFIFHIWNLQVEPPALFERTVCQVAPHIPKDNAKGQWKTVQIPVGT
jgi:hypothetical protein